MPTAFQVRPFQPSDLPVIVRLHQDSRPLHPWTLEEIQRDLELLEPHLQHHFLVAEASGEVVGMVNYQRPVGSYHPHRFLLQLCVVREHQGRGVGRALYDAAVRELELLDPLSAMTLVRETDVRGLRFAESRGFVEVKRDFESVLHLDTFDASPYKGLTERLQTEGFRFRTFAELDSTDFRRRFHALFEEVRVDVPRAEPPTPLTFEFFEKHVIEEPGLLPTAFVFALQEDDLMGFTGGYEGAEPGVMDTWLTAVRRSVRGRGLALALKVRSVQEARALGRSRVRTDNDTRNAPMLRVNERMGFQRQPALITLRKVFREA